MPAVQSIVMEPDPGGHFRLIKQKARLLSMMAGQFEETTFVIADSASLTDDPRVAHGGFNFSCHCGRHPNQREADFGQHALENV
jgi:hypothetical protein